MSGRLSIKQEYTCFLTLHFTLPNNFRLSMKGVINTLNYTFKPPPALTAEQCTQLLNRILLFRAFKADNREWLKSEYKRLSLIREKLLANSGDFELT